MNPGLPAFKTNADRCGGKTISEDRAEDEADLRAQLARERIARAAAERELAELQAHRRHLESRAINARQTLAYGLGRALIEARTAKGLIGLPGRLRTLWLRQKAKRKERVPDTSPSDIAVRLQIADEARERAQTEGLPGALAWLDRRPDDAAKARALADLAILAADEDREHAGRIGLMAARLAPGESRLLGVMAALESAGAADAPARIGQAISDAQPLSQPQRTWIARLERDRALLAGKRDGATDLAPRGLPGRVERLFLVAPERWRSHPRLAAASQAADAAGIAVDFGFPPGNDEAAVAHIFPDSLSCAEDAMTQAAEGAIPVLLDLANRPAAIAADPASEAGRVAALRFDRLVRAADRVIVRGPAMARLLEDRGVGAVRVEEEWPLAGTPAQEDVATARREFGIGSGERVVGAVADLHDDGGWRKLLSAFGELRRAGLADRLAIVGRGPGAGWLAQQAAAAGCEDGLVFPGVPFWDRWPALFESFDAIVFPSDREETLGSEWPMAMVLAARLGLPMLFSDAAWHSRTTDAIARGPADGDWTAALRDMLDGPRIVAEPPSEAGLRPLYAALRGG